MAKKTPPQFMKKGTPTTGGVTGKADKTEKKFPDSKFPPKKKGK